MKNCLVLLILFIILIVTCFIKVSTIENFDNHQNDEQRRINEMINYINRLIFQSGQPFQARISLLK